MGFYLHGVTPRFEAFSILVYADALGLPETAHNQAQRMLYATRTMLDVDATELFWGNQTDNTGKATNVARFLGLRGLRCVAHLLVLGPRRLTHPVRRQVEQPGGDVVTMWAMHERAVPGIYNLFQKARGFWGGDLFDLNLIWPKTHLAK